MTSFQTANDRKALENTYRVSGKDPYIVGETKKNCKKIQRSNLLQLCKQGYKEKGLKSLTSLRIIEEIKLGVSFAGNVCQIYGYAFVSKKRF